MTSPYARPLPPLRDLPPPPRLPDDHASLVPPGEILLDSTAQIRRRLLRRAWAPLLVLVGLWLVLVWLYVSGTSPTLWVLSLLFSLGDTSLLRSALSGLGFTGRSLLGSFTLVPLLGTALSLALIPLAPRAIASLRPQRFLSEKEFQRTVADRLTAVLMLPPLLTVLVLPLTVLLGMPQPWKGLSTGALSSWCLGVLALQLTWILVRRTLAVPRLLGQPDPDTLRRTAQIGTDHDARRAAAAQVLAQDRRHLPPSSGTPEEGAALTPLGAARALRAIGRESLRWVVPAGAALGWLVFGISDIVIVFSGILSTDLMHMRAPTLSATVLPLLLTGVITALVVLAASLAPALSIELSRPQRAEVIDQRTYEDWAHRARVNPWETRVATLTGWFTAGAAAAGSVLLGVALSLVQLPTALAWAVMLSSLLVLSPLLGGAATHAMRRSLRDVLYGPPGQYMRRSTPWALVAPDIGTCADRAKDPAVRAELRKRLQAEGGDHALAIFDLDADGERLWIDENAPGARTTQVREAEIAAGQLPDFGGGADPSADPADHARTRDHHVPGSVTELREL